MNEERNEEKIIDESCCNTPVTPSVKKGSPLKKYIGIACLSVVLCAGSMAAGVGIGELLKKENPAPTASTEQAASASKPVAVQLSENGNDIAQIFKSVENSIVSINTKMAAQNMFFQYQQYAGAGSGIVYGDDDSKIYIATNYHVINGANNATVSFDGEKEVPASYVGSDPKSDLAVISVSKDELKKAGIANYSIARFGDSDKLEVGESVLAIGNALGEGKSVTSGIISAKNKTIDIENKELKVIQTDAAINPGNSGGALVNKAGQVIGINTAKYSSAGVEGMGYSIPSNSAKEIIDEIILNGSVERPYLGISGVTISDEMKDAYGFTTNGVYVAGVMQGGAADKSGMVAQDIIVGFGDKKIASMEDLQEALNKTKVGDSVKIYVYRDSVPVVLDAQIGNLNEGPSF